MADFHVFLSPPLFFLPIHLRSLSFILLKEKGRRGEEKPIGDEEKNGQQHALRSGGGRRRG